MSLVVAAIHDDDRITMVSDTKVSFFYPDGRPDDATTRRTYVEALPKIVLLRPDLMVGVTGDQPHEVIDDLIGHRADTIDDLLTHLAANTSAGFVVAALGPARVWHVEGGKIDDRTGVRRAWSGDRRAYDVFRTSWEQWPDGTDVPFLLSSSMQRLTSFDPVASVGGFTLTAATYDDGFRFQPWVTTVFMSHHVHVMPGQDPTRGALGLLIPETGVGLLFPHERPSAATRIGATTSRAVADLAIHRGQRLIVTAAPGDA
ncbi:hypothetical protein [Nocardioides aequoreus]|uniref:hypothetical protein n=1 Tax=Nocardioides aequoreus TaxID=397278 RepID=UPI0004C2C040|nr:hypothetical protein [Nocardioides aequoreus]